MAEKAITGAKSPELPKPPSRPAVWSGDERLVPAGQQAALVGQVLGGHRVAEVIAPVAVDVEVPVVVRLLPEAQLLHDPAARRVVGADVDLDAVQAPGAERVVDDQGQRGRGDALAGE